MIRFSSRSKQNLGGAWTMAHTPDAEYAALPPPARPDDLSAAGLTVYPATVPGNFELDLFAAGAIPDPFVGMNIAHLHRFEDAHVWYATTFTTEGLPEGETWLVFEGLDCFAEVFLNGEKIGATDNMLVPWEFDVTHRLRRGDANDLLVHILPATVEATRRYDYPPGAVAQASTADALYTRKAPHMYGWDIMPRALSAGIWRPVRLEVRPAERLESVYLETQSASEGSARLALSWKGRFPHASGRTYEIEIEGRCGDSTFRERRRLLFVAGRFAFSVPRPRRWWPRGRGPADLYEVAVRLLRDGEEVDRAEFRYGIRTVVLDRTAVTDPAGSGEFRFLVNGEPVFILGSNWVPADAYHSRDRERIPRMLELAEEVGCNLLRCWGGNVYEDDLFYDLCDEKGLLIWQDFTMACTIYPQDDAFARRLADEATAVVRRLRHHACIAIWSGDNECDEAYLWNERGDPNGNRLTRQVLPAVLATEDPARHFLPSSPYIAPEAYAVPASRRRQHLPEAHLWGPRDHYKSPYYLNSACHFASEIGYHACPSPESVRRFITPEKLWPAGNDEWLLHATSPVPGVNLFDYRIDLMFRQIRETFGVTPATLEEFAFLSQCVQAEAKKFFVEWFRAGKWRRTGIVWWNLIDGWPQFSDAVVGYYYDKKLAFDYLTRSQQPICLLLREPQDWGQDLVASNDTRHESAVRYTVRDVATGEALLTGEGAARADAVTVLGRLPFSAGTHRFYLIEWESDLLGAGRNHYLAGFPPFDPVAYAGWLRASGLVPPERIPYP